MTVLTPDPVDDVDTETLDLRGLVMSGGKPYILITLEDPETGGIDISHLGVEATMIPTALREIAKLLEAGE